MESETKLNIGDSTNCFLGAVIHVPIESYYAGNYRLEYDGKYITLLGRDKNYKCFSFSEDKQ